MKHFNKGKEEKGGGRKGESRGKEEEKVEGREGGRKMKGDGNREGRGEGQDSRKSKMIRNTE
jgi:hypothetical protein